ncbi:M23 family metallopeptidase [Curtobacterium sp. MCBA15_004]|uniref:M23 family metallopeptidase n=1 Tax=unclassified Curtobacterium TaxID=257496 RepID=UPI0008DE6C84|nr:M23 family metallopeptidase [Curtobacterium sp. MCBA15_004]WIA96742.1 M23 family metallopeptidase [Curtobacterium sp. MCBA15_004]
MTTTHDHHQQQPGTPVVHLSRRAALEAERAAARRPARRTRSTAPAAQAPAPAAPAAQAHVAKAPAPAAQAPATQAPAVQAPVASTAATTAAPSTPPARAGRRATRARAATEHVDTRITKVVRRRAAGATSVPAARRASRPSRGHRASRVTLTSALAALAMFAASAMPAHAAAGTSLATSTIAPVVRTQDYAVTQAIAASASDRDGFTIGGGTVNPGNGTAGAAGSAVSYGGDVRSPFPGPVRMSSGFGYRSAPCGACSSLHQGLDFNPGMGAPIGAVAAGKVRVSGTYFSYGTAVVIDHVIDGRKVATLYGHMIPGSSPLKVGDRVEAGQFIGKVGSSGVSTGAHLHLEVLLDGVTPIDPEAWLEARIGRSLTP